MNRFGWKGLTAGGRAEKEMAASEEVEEGGFGCGVVWCGVPSSLCSSISFLLFLPTLCLPILD